MFKSSAVHTAFTLFNSAKVEAHVVIHMMAQR